VLTSEIDYNCVVYIDVHACDTLML